ncbi:MAG: GrpB family protein [Chloroflexota bacterium]
MSRDDEIRAATIGAPTRADGPINLAEYDPAWPATYEVEAVRIRSILGDRVRLLEHAGSTAVPGLAAKPIIDIILAVPDSANEAAYVPPMEAAGYVLRIREPDWFEHRLFRGPVAAINLHVFSDRCPEIDRMLAFRDRLRTHDDDRMRYETAKRQLAARDWTYIQHYADAKGEVVEGIIARALEAAR